MNQKGQTTILFTIMMSILFIFTLTALEVERVYTSKVKLRSVVHSAQVSIMADYNEDLFEKYHLLFIDPTYGTESAAALEEKMKDYLEVSLNGESCEDGNLYQYTIDEIAVVDLSNILDENMELLKKQIVEYEKMTGVKKRAEKVFEEIKNKDSKIKDAATETEINGVEITSNEKDEEVSNQEDNVEVEDPRETLKNSLGNGILSFVLPTDKMISNEDYHFMTPPSKIYKEEKEEEKNNEFQDISFLKSFINKQADEDEIGFFEKRMATLDYYDYHFSNIVESNDKKKIRSEAEYILKGKNSDSDNVKAVVNDILWMRMPINYAYLLTDTMKKSEALSVATGICIATNTEPLIEVVKYLLLGCWAYGESLYEMKLLLSGSEVPYVKTKENWYTDLKTPGCGESKKVKGLKYDDYLMILLARKSEKKMNLCYARMLDLIEYNLQTNNPNFEIEKCVGKLTIQGKIKMNPLFIKKDSEAYDYYFEEKIEY